ncbi:MAG: hypothetical protein IK064_02545 [Clostridia bacterium]|nr:hypothetical protein [Clostridia bacterium]
MAVKAEKTNTALTKAQKIVLLAVFLGFIAVFSLLILFLPKREGQLSPNERRVLAEAPNGSFQNIVSGKFSGEVDSWLQDHFPARTFFVSVYSYLNRWTGRNPVETISLGKGNRLFETPEEANSDIIDTNVGKLTRFIDKNSLTAHSYIIPTAAYMLENDLPSPHLTYHDGELIAGLNEALSGRVTPISAEETLKNGDTESLYYRTDHHLTMRGSYVSYCAIAKELGLTPLAESEFTKTGYEFYGTYYGRSGLFLTPADTLETWVGPYDADLTVTTVDGGSETVHRGSLDTACLAEGVADKYAAYLYSNHGITRVENPNAEGGTLLVLKDSYGNAIVPFLAAHYKLIVMIDVRSLYYSMAMPSPSTLCEEYGISDFIIITGLDTVVGGTLDWLR